MFSSLTSSALIAQIQPWLTVLAVPLGVIIGIPLAFMVLNALLQLLGFRRHADQEQAQTQSDAARRPMTMRDDGYPFDDVHGGG